MTGDTLLIGLAGLILLAIIVVAVQAGIFRTRSGRVRLEPKPLMTPIERETIAYIESAVPHCRVHAQVAMGALMRTEKGLSRQDQARWRNRYSQKIIDYVLEDRGTGQVVALVELDDRTHDAARDRQRDELTDAVGYNTIRLPAGERPTRENVRARIITALTIRQEPPRAAEAGTPA